MASKKLSWETEKGAQLSKLTYAYLNREFNNFTDELQPSTLVEMHKLDVPITFVAINLFLLMMSKVGQ